MATTHVVMRGEHPVAVVSTPNAARSIAEGAYTEYMSADRIAATQFRWDDTEWPERDMVLKVRSQSTGRWVKTSYRIVQVPFVS